VRDLKRQRHAEMISLDSSPTVQCRCVHYIWGQELCACLSRPVMLIRMRVSDRARGAVSDIYPA
jgi:hypothetical protein